MLSNIALHARQYSLRNSLPSYTKPRFFHKGLAETLSKILGVRDPALRDHSLRVATLATKLARYLQLPEEQVDVIRRGSLLHDIGKLCLPQELLSQPGLLTARQFATIQTHPGVGAVLLQECLEYRDLIPIVLHHHEFFNGQGYPDQIAGDEIEVEARIVAVADAVDSMACDHPYRKALTPAQIIAELELGTNTQFDPVIVEGATWFLREKAKSSIHQMRAAVK